MLVPPQRSYHEFSSSKLFPEWMVRAKANKNFAVNSWEDYDAIANKAVTSIKSEALMTYNYHLAHKFSHNKLHRAFFASALYVISR